MRKLLILALGLLLCLTILTSVAGATATSDSIYSFTYHYTNGSGDYYNGYVFAPSGWFIAGSTISNQPAEMGGASLGGGYYYITSVTSGANSLYDAQEYITSYYDANTGKTTSYIASSTGSTVTTCSLYVADRKITAENGYAYDPSVPTTDPYFGNSDVCYSFSTSSNAGYFLESYTSVPYWEIPTSYRNGSAETAAATLIGDINEAASYFRLITTDSNWQTDWPNYTQDSPTSYVTLIGKLATDMGWTATNGTYASNVESGLTTYIWGQGYTSMNQGGSLKSTYYNVTAATRASAWTTFTNGNASSYVGANGCGILELNSTAFNSSGVTYGVGHGYWNNGYVVFEENGNNYVINWNNPSDGGTKATAEVIGDWNLQYYTISPVGYSN